MSSLTYTKKCIFEFSTKEGLIAHAEQYQYSNFYDNQIFNGIGDPDRVFLPFRYTSPTTSEVLCVNQSQAEDLITMSTELGDTIGHPIVANAIVDFNDSIEKFDNYIDSQSAKVVVIDFHTVENAKTGYWRNQQQYLAWFRNEIANTQTVSGTGLLPYNYVSPTVCLGLAKDIEQAERWIEFEQQQAKELGYTITCNIIDYSDERTDFKDAVLYPREF